MFLALQVDSLPAELPGKPKNTYLAMLGFSCISSSIDQNDAVNSGEM